MIHSTICKVTQKAFRLRFVEVSLLNSAQSVYNTSMNIIPIFVPHEGCRTRCIFCNEYSATGVTGVPDEKEIVSTVEKYLSFFRHPEDVELAFYGGTFTGFGNQQKYLEVATEFFKAGQIKGIRFSTSPGLISERLVEYLKPYPVNFIELGVQSFDDTVLEKSNRDHNTSDVYKATHLLNSNGIKFGIHLMTGLPEDSESKDIHSTREAIRVGASSVRLHPLVILKGSLLENEYKLRRFSPLDLQESIEILWKMYLLLSTSNVKINRIGICLYGKQIDNVVAGPFHPAIGELVRDRLFLEIVRAFSGEMKRNELRLHNKFKPFFTGHKKGIVEEARKEGILIDFAHDGEEIDVSLYMRRIKERVLEGVYAEA
ncbi:histone acetyltransferase [Mesotoga prima MesG1.Ag.4.2]|uniref:Histone acetyltransferase n=2 Tax=Mesotoga prima TaxID=1184387 RepID=I2F2M9_9BACT|nr:histone acetyltransferase [Mesotoga prima MesG1.Ag.4.2]